MSKLLDDPKVAARGGSSSGGEGVSEIETIKQVLMRRDNMSADEADEAIEEARERVASGEDPEDVLAEEFGLELDYIFDLI